MNYTINKKNCQPAYIQLYNQLRDDIISGIYSEGEKLPSKRLLAEETGTSVITTEHAFSLLCEEGYAESRERSGYIVIFRKSDGFVNTSQQSVDTSETFRRNKTEFPFSVYSKAVRKVLTEYGEAVLSKTDNRGCEALRIALSRYLAAARGIKAQPEQIIIGSGSEYLYGLIIEMAGKDTRFAIENPSYNKIELVYSLSGATYDKLPLGKDGIESEALQSCKADFLHISPFRSYPSGVTASASKRHEYMRWAESGNRFIIEDDFESEFSVSSKPAEVLFAHSKNDNVIYLNSFSMTVSPGLRTGYAVLPKQLLGRFQDKVGFYSCTVPTLDQLVLATLISSGDFERHINRTRRNKRKQLAEI